jgi:hypothetical protein
MSDIEEGETDKYAQPTTCEKIQACPGYTSHAIWHVSEDHKGVKESYCCFLRPWNWVQVFAFLTVLYIISIAFWALMFYFVSEWPMDSLWAFLIAFGAFCLLFAALMALNMSEDEDSKTLGCSPKQLREHIDRLMDEEMTWTDFGTKWHITHKMPLQEDNPSAELNERILHVCKCLHYENTVPIWDRDLQEQLSPKSRVTKMHIQKKAKEPNTLETKATTTTTVSTPPEYENLIPTVQQ